MEGYAVVGFPRGGIRQAAASAPPPTPPGTPPAAAGNHVYTDAAGEVYADTAWFSGDVRIGYNNGEGEITRRVGGNGGTGSVQYRMSYGTVVAFANQNWDAVKTWNADIWELYFMQFGEASAGQAAAIRRGIQERIMQSGVALPRLSPEDKRYMEGMVVFAAVTKFVEVGYPVVMSEVLMTIFAGGIIGSVVEVGVEAGVGLTVRYGGQAMKIGGTKLTQLVNFLVQKGKLPSSVANNATGHLDEVAVAFKSYVDDAAEAVAGRIDSALVARIKAQLDRYPKVIDPRTGRPIPFPAGIKGRVEKALRTVWDSKKDRAAFIGEWHRRGYATPRGGWEKYDIHHIQPLEFGGTNDFLNLVPVERETHQEVFNRFWSMFMGL